MLIHSGLSERVWFRFLLFEWYSRAWISNASMPLYTSTFMTNMRQTEFTAHGQNFHRNPPIHIVRKFHFTLVIFINTQDLLWHIEKKKMLVDVIIGGSHHVETIDIYLLYTQIHMAPHLCVGCALSTRIFIRADVIFVCGLRIEHLIELVDQFVFLYFFAASLAKCMGFQFWRWAFFGRGTYEFFNIVAAKK